ncbi:pyridoxamine 5'-phosphate oxidase family protein [Gulosibacter bifidus]|uniref:Pyridoxamine 5'-phosphate oxidase family protein n=1 Tax=Gulosibacter bifidus TaxID=272239 RepID=A0ABW5RJ72_9MICO|nr:pyridoxamine 5'-phosphate oxidase family protein [Gulosibacter bifidus]
MSDYDDVMMIPTEAEARQLLASQTVGRLVERIGEHVEIFPINYAIEGDLLIFRTAPGTKLAAAVAADEVFLQTDYVSETEAWSVIVTGAARILDRDDEIERAEQLDLRPLVPSVKRVFVAIDIESISARRFELGPEPEAEPETIA